MQEIEDAVGENDGLARGTKTGNEVERVGDCEQLLFLLKPHTI